MITGAGGGGRGAKKTTKLIVCMMLLRISTFPLFVFFSLFFMGELHSADSLSHSF